MNNPPLRDTSDPLARGNAELPANLFGNHHLVLRRNKHLRHAPSSQCITFFISIIEVYNNKSEVSSHLLCPFLRHAEELEHLVYCDMEESLEREAEHSFSIGLAFENRFRGGKVRSFAGKG
jgi:hypothetical protein